MYAAKKVAEAIAAGDEASQRYWERVRDVVDAAPELTAEQRDRLRILLRPATSKTALTSVRAPVKA